MDQQLLLFVCIGGAVALVAFFMSRMFVGGGDGRLRERLTGKGAQQVDKPKAATVDNVKSVAKKIGQAAAQPFMPSSREKQSTLRRELGFAGIYTPSSVKVVVGSKVIFLFLGVVIGYIMGMWIDMMFLGISLGGLIGYFVPRLWLKSRVKKNQLALQLALPDALDLMVVCVEAGLTVDASFQRVGEELSLAHPALSRELGMTHMETRVGLARAEALKNMATRTGSTAIQSLVAMLVQADRFGTSVANALRIQSDSLRVKRQQAAEEMAAKASVKMSFPLVLFIFPATFIVLAGPTVIGLMNSEIMK